MAIDTPARLAILGAGPIGLEAALYARFLGYDVLIYEQGQIGASVRQWSHVRMFTPFVMNRTTLGLAAMQAQDDSYQPPADDALLTGQEWLHRYLVPLAATDLLSDHLRLHTTVIAVGKEELLKYDLPNRSHHAPRDEPSSLDETSSIDSRGDWSFRVLSKNAAGAEQIDLFDGVLDCTGVFTNANWLGHGGIPAIGELALRDQIEYRLPDILGPGRPRYAGKHTLLIGAGMSAATNAVALAELAANEPGTRITWITRREGPAGSGGPIAVFENDPLPERAKLARRANELAVSGGLLTHWPRTVVEQVQRTNSAGAFELTLSGEHAGSLVVDSIIANVGFRPDHSICEELQTPTEPNYYILGSKGSGRRSNFLLTEGYEQIRDVFTLIGDRAALDLYSTVGKASRLP